jgi:hypothetical protein
VNVRDRLGRGYVKIGEGEHSEVFHRPTSGVVLQLFRPGCSTLTITKVVREYHYLRYAYAELPALVPWQRLLTPHPGAHISDTILIKRYIPVDTTLPLRTSTAGQLLDAGRHQLATFLRITRNLLTHPGLHVLIPDIIDTHLHNLALDTTGCLRLLDTNRLINTRALAALGPGDTLDPAAHPIHARVLQRMMFLECRYTGRHPAALAADPLYRRYLHLTDVAALHRDSAARGEPLSDHHRV